MTFGTPRQALAFEPATTHATAEPRSATVLIQVPTGISSHEKQLPGLSALLDVTRQEERKKGKWPRIKPDQVFRTVAVAVVAVSLR
jgi:hypothetical protein